MRQDPDGYARSCEALAEMQAADTSRIDCPTLLVTGDEDAVAPPQAVRMMGEQDRGQPGRGAARLRALDAGREARGVHRSVESIPAREETDMANVLFTNVRIIDATGAQPYTGEVLVQGNRISRIGRGSRSLPRPG